MACFPESLKNLAQMLLIYILNGIFCVWKDVFLSAGWHVDGGWPVYGVGHLLFEESCLGCYLELLQDVLVPEVIVI